MSFQTYIPAPREMRKQKRDQQFRLRKMYITIDEPDVQLKFNYLKMLARYSKCISPYLRVAQDKYASQYIVLYEGHHPELLKYCTQQWKEVQDLKKQLQTMQAEKYLQEAQKEVKDKKQ